MNVTPITLEPPVICNLRRKEVESRLPFHLLYPKTLPLAFFLTAAAPCVTLELILSAAASYLLASSFIAAASCFLRLSLRCHLLLPPAALLPHASSFNAAASCFVLQRCCHLDASSFVAAASELLRRCCLLLLPSSLLPLASSSIAAYADASPRPSEHASPFISVDSCFALHGSHLSLRPTSICLTPRFVLPHAPSQ